MANFTQIDSEYSNLPALLAEYAPAFVHSLEYGRLDDSDFELPIVVCGAFTRYISRLLVADLSQAKRRQGRAVDEVFEAIERLVASPDPEVVNTVVVEIYEHLGGAALQVFKSRLGKQSRELYDKWVVE